MLVHVALDLHAEELRGEHHPRLPVPVPDAVARRLRVEGTPRVLVETDGDDDVGGAGADRVVRADRARSPPVAQPLATLMNGTPVSPSLDTSVSASPAAAEPPNAYSHPRPLDAGVGQRGAGRVCALLEARQRVAAERVDPGPHDRNICHTRPPPVDHQACGSLLAGCQVAEHDVNKVPSRCGASVGVASDRDRDERKARVRCGSDVTP